MLKAIDEMLHDRKHMSSVAMHQMVVADGVATFKCYLGDQHPVVARGRTLPRRPRAGFALL